MTLIEIQQRLVILSLQIEGLNLRLQDSLNELQERGRSPSFRRRKYQELQRIEQTQETIAQEIKTLRTQLRPHAPN